MNEPTFSIKDLEDIEIIYIRFNGSYMDFRKNSRKLFTKLFKFATKNNLVDKNITKVITMYNDNPYITKDTNLRTSVAMIIPRNSNVIDEDEICHTSLSGRFLVGHFELSLKEYEEAWHYIYHDYLFKSALTPRDAIPFELYVDEPPKNLKDKSFTDIYIPIE